MTVSNSALTIRELSFGATFRVWDCLGIGLRVASYFHSSGLEAIPSNRRRLPFESRYGTLKLRIGQPIPGGIAVLVIRSAPELQRGIDVELAALEIVNEPKRRARRGGFVGRLQTKVQINRTVAR